MFKANSREEIEEFLNHDNHLKYILDLSTGVGKSRLSLLKMAQWREIFGGCFLIVIPKLVLIDNWKTEFKKIGFEDLLNVTVFTTYNSLQKHLEDEWTAVIFDEVQHLSDRCKFILENMRYKCFLGLSATIKKDLKNWLWYNIRGLEWVKMGLKDAIDNEVLPNPKVILIPLKLDNKAISEVIVKNPKAKKSLEVSYQDRYKCRDKNIKYHIHCTQQQWYNETESLIAWLDQHAPKFAYLKKCGERLKWLSEKKTEFVKELLRRITRHRVIVFCNNIEQSKMLGMNSINSKDGMAQEILDKFNNREINKVTVVAILNEGVNVSDCKIGVFANLNASETITVQRSGRILRHKQPVIIIPYYINTRDEVLAMRMIQNYDPNMIVTITDLNELKEHLK